MAALLTTTLATTPLELLLELPLEDMALVPQDTPTMVLTTPRS
jgi:hypothetical protein